MSNSLRVWTACSADGYMSAVAPELKLDVIDRLNKQPLMSSWKSLQLNRDHIKRSDRKSDILTIVGCPCFRRAAAPQLITTDSASIELLPASLEGEEWCILNCLRTTVAIDFSSSDLLIPEIPNLPGFEECRPTIADIRWINVVEPAALAERWEVFCVPVSSHPQAYRRQLLTDAFVDRVRALGLCGLDFKHVGYIVPDASQAVPKPPEPPAPPLKPSRRKDPKLTIAPLPVAEQIELARAGAEWRQRLQLASDASAETVLQRLTQELQAKRPTFWTVTADERIDATLGLSAIYGELLCGRCGWSWAELRQSRSKRWIAVTSADGRHALALLPYIQQQMQSEAPTVTLLFNMIRAGDLPRAEAGQTVLVA
jgi:hypothetical protein